MLRIVRISLGVVCLICVQTGLRATPPASDDDTSLKNALAVQQALSQARHYLYQSDPGRAVEILEEQLPRINGNSTYLRTLREAYRCYIQELWVANNPKEARRYLERLCVIDPAAAQDKVLSGQAAPPARPIDVKSAAAGSTAETPPIKAPQPMIAPQPSTAASPMTSAPPAVTKQEELTPTATAAVEPTGASRWSPVASAVTPVEQGPVLRGKLRDPFDMTNQRFGSEDRSLARQLQVDGEGEYALQHFDEARKCFERAYQADPQAIGGVTREHWAYCILNYVSRKMNQSAITADRLEELRKLVNSATIMSPAVSDSSQKTLRDIDSRRAELDNTGADAIAIEHKGKNAQGWQIAETAHFRVLYMNEEQGFVEKVARTAETTRRDMFRKWFGHDGVRWDSKCDVFLHATAAEYSKATGAPLDAPGHASIDWNKTGVVSRRIDVHREQNGLLDTLLPRETTHVVLAGMFGAAPLPKWADVGMAVLTESAGRVGEHRRNLAKCQKDGTLYMVRALLQLPDYPQKERIQAFYAQSIVLVEFLASQRGPTVFSEFLRDAGREGHELALRRHYGWNFSDLEMHWSQYVLNESNRLARAQ
jgi:tetratricopeptide (TPR) repeat protein